MSVIRDLRASNWFIGQFSIPCVRHVFENFITFFQFSSHLFKLLHYWRFIDFTFRLHTYTQILVRRKVMKSITESALLWLIKFCIIISRNFKLVEMISDQIMNYFVNWVFELHKLSLKWFVNDIALILGRSTSKTYFSSFHFSIFLI